MALISDHVVVQLNLYAPEKCWTIIQARPWSSRRPTARLLRMAGDPHAAQISPDKDINFHCTSTSFTLSNGITGLRDLVLAHPRTKPHMTFLFVASQFCYKLPPHSPSRHCTCSSLAVRVFYDESNNTVILLQGTFTPLVNAHDGRTQRAGGDS